MSEVAVRGADDTFSARSFSAQNLPDLGATSALYAELRQLGLVENIAELDVFGFTVVPPEKVGPPALHDKVKAALIAVVEERFGALASDGTTWQDTNQIFRLVLWENRVFEELVLNPAGLGLVQHLLGHNCILSLFDGWVKGPGEERTAIHPDHWDFNRRTFPAEPMSANFNYLVTDYTAEEGASCGQRQCGCRRHGAVPKPVRPGARRRHGDPAAGLRLRGVRPGSLAGAATEAESGDEGRGGGKRT